MSISVRDGVATIFVAAAVIVSALSATGTALAGWPARLTAAVVFALGFAACVTDQKQMALVYGAEPARPRPPASYAVLASVLGAAALTTGILALVTASTAMTVALTATIAALWAVATVRHALAYHDSHSRLISP